MDQGNFFDTYRADESAFGNASAVSQYGPSSLNSTMHTGSQDHGMSDVEYEAYLRSVEESYQLTLAIHQFYAKPQNAGYLI